MILLPAIDILDGKAVRLSRGDYSRVTVYNEDTLAQAHAFELEGASWIHVVDLDGARSGTPQNLDAIERIVSQTALKVEVGGGIRSMETLRAYASCGASRMVLGTALIKDPDFARTAADEFGSKIVAGIDARAGEVAVEGWCEGSGQPASLLAAQLAGMGIENLIYTDISRDGMQSGVDADVYARLATDTELCITASGGISSLDDLRALKETGVIWGAISGRAIYEGAFSVCEAVEILEG